MEFKSVGQTIKRFGYLLLNLKDRIFQPMEDDLIQGHYDKIVADFELIRCMGSDCDSHGDIIQRIDSLLQENQSWSNLYVLERLMIKLYDPQQLKMELKDAIREFNEISSAGENGVCREEEIPRLDDQARRACLGQLLTNIEHIQRKNSLTKKYKRKMTFRTALIFIASFPAFYAQSLFPEFCENVFNFNTPGCKASIILTAIAAGWMGASFSMLLNMRKRLNISRLEDLRIQRTYGFIFSRIFIGIGAALILFYFFQASMLTGDMLPTLKNTGEILSRNDAAKTIVDQKSHAMLILWFFIAGFSESFVPALLTKTQKAVGS